MRMKIKIHDKKIYKLVADGKRDDECVSFMWCGEEREAKTIEKREKKIVTVCEGKDQDSKMEDEWFMRERERENQ